jgi:hypothetical protein
MGTEHDAHGDRRLSAAARTAKALELRAQGRTYREIARELGFKSVASAYGAVSRGLAAVIKEPAEDVRQLELLRLDELLTSQWFKAIGGDDKAVGRVLQIMDRRSRYLGLDIAPTVDLRLYLANIAACAGLDADELIEEAEAIIRRAKEGGWFDGQ